MYPIFNPFIRISWQYFLSPYIVPGIMLDDEGHQVPQNKFVTDDRSGKLGGSARFWVSTRELLAIKFKCTWSQHPGAMGGWGNPFQELAWISAFSIPCSPYNSGSSHAHFLSFLQTLRTDFHLWAALEDLSTESPWEAPSSFRSLPSITTCQSIQHPLSSPSIHNFQSSGLPASLSLC